MGGIIKWINMLLGRPVAGSKPEVKKADPSEEKVETQKDKSEGDDEVEISREEMEDSVASDIKKFKKAAKGFFSKVSTKVGPYAQKGTSGSSKALKKAGGLIDQ